MAVLVPAYHIWVYTYACGESGLSLPQLNTNPLDPFDAEYDVSAHAVIMGVNGVDVNTPAG